MSSSEGDAAATTLSRPDDPVRLTSKSTDLAGFDDVAMDEWPDGHPRGGDKPIRAARWVGAPQPLRAGATLNGRQGPSSLETSGNGCHSGAIAALAALPERLGTRFVPLHGATAANPDSLLDRTQENARVLNLIDLELHAGRQVMIAVCSVAGCSMAEDRLFRIMTRSYWPDGTVYYTALDDADGGRAIELYVHEDDLSLINPD